MPNQNSPEVLATIARLKNVKDMNPPVLGSKLDAIRVAQNNGYPKWMRHSSQPPVLVETEQLEVALAAAGFVPHYIPQAFPTTIFRRNNQTIQRNENGRVVVTPKFEDCTETRIVQDPDQLAKALEEKPSSIYSKWFGTPEEMPPMEGHSTEDPAVTIARLQEQLSAATKLIAEKVAADKAAAEVPPAATKK